MAVQDHNLLVKLYTSGTSIKGHNRKFLLAMDNQRTKMDFPIVLKHHEE